MPQPLNREEAEILPAGISVSSLFNDVGLSTFRHGMNAPIHRWFRYPTGFSHKLVDEAFRAFRVQPGEFVYDPFGGGGTTLICAKQHGIDGFAVEAHPFVHWVAETKLHWEFDLVALRERVTSSLADLRDAIDQRITGTKLDGVFPPLVHKAFHPSDLKTLFIIRQFIVHKVAETPYQNLLKLALTDTLRSSATARVGWPYIVLRNTGEKRAKDAPRIFEATLQGMVDDLAIVADKANSCIVHNVLGDSRETQFKAQGDGPLIENEQIDFVITSPPYLNNYDYADRTRLEMSFWGQASSWSDITRLVRDKLIVAATTQVRRSEYDLDMLLRPELSEGVPEVCGKLNASIALLSKRRLERGGRKDYDIMVGQYFNDMYDVLRETFRVLKKGGYFCLVLGDSAPYGVHIPTERYIAEITKAIGFSDYVMKELRKRGNQWTTTPHRHNVPLREVIVIVQK